MQNIRLIKRQRKKKKKNKLLCQMRALIRIRVRGANGIALPREIIQADI